MSSRAASSSRERRLLAPAPAGRVGAWVYALRTTNSPPDRDPRTLDAVTTWLVVTRAATLSMTLFAGLVAGLLGVLVDGFSWPLYLLALLGILLAHACTTIMSGLSDVGIGRDTGDDARAVHAPHPLLTGTVKRRQMGLAVLGLHLTGLVMLVALATQRGWPVLAFGLAGVFLSIAYHAPPLRLNKRGLGELGAFLVWGPLMVGGTYFSATGELPWQVWLASLPYGLLCTSVLMGEHIDKIPYDELSWTRTLPVRLGGVRARVATIALLVGFYVTTGVAVAVGALPWPVLLVALALPTLRKASGALRRPAPADPPPGFPVWPLWFAAVCFVHVRRAGALLVLGLLVAAVTGTGLPLG
ncbi:MAG: prenyltransferase [Mycobacteriales bacterium]